ncbi:MAG: hypothetical protein JNM84_05410 [Planctomycetes bacterium]|nr:hypothetical protein [Planctomycetota bacterium]
MTMRSFWSAVLVLGCFSADAALADNLYLAGGKEIFDVEVKKADAKEVVYVKEGKRETLEAWQVEYIEYSDVPVAYVEAYEAYQNGRQDAAALFDKCLQDQRLLKKHKWLQSTASYFQALALKDARDHKNASAKLEAFVNDAASKESYLYPLALMALSDWNKNDSKWADRIVEESKSGAISGKWQFDARIYLIRKVKDEAQMRKQLEELAAEPAAQAYPGVRYRVMTTMAGIDIKGGAFDKAEKVYAQIASANDAEDAVLAEAFYGLGVSRFALWERAKPEDQAKSFSSTWEPLLNTYVTYKATLDPVQAQEMLYKAAAVFYSSSEPGFEQRATALVEKLRSLPGDSEWKTKADKLKPKGK